VQHTNVAGTTKPGRRPPLNGILLHLKPRSHDLSRSIFCFKHALSENHHTETGAQAREFVSSSTPIVKRTQLTKFGQDEPWLQLGRSPTCPRPSQKYFTSPEAAGERPSSSTLIFQNKFPYTFRTTLRRESGNESPYSPESLHD
jgi:hypothetical protein